MCGVQAAVVDVMVVAVVIVVDVAAVFVVLVAVVAGILLLLHLWNLLSQRLYLWHLGIAHRCAPPLESNERNMGVAWA